MPPKKQGVRPPSLGEVFRAKNAEMKARVEKLRNTYVEPILQRFPRMLPTKPDSAAKYAIVSSVLWFAVGLLLALLLAVKLVFPRTLAQFPWMSYGRLAGAETAVMTWGVLFMGFTGSMFAIVPRLCGVKLWSERIGAQTVALLDQVVLAGVVLLLIGRTQGITGLELPWPIDLLILNCVLMVAQNVFATVARRTEKQLSVPLWYFIASIPTLLVTYAFGNLAAPWYFGVNQQIVAGFAVAGTAAALTMMGVGTAYFVLAKASGRPIYSARLAQMGFWSFVFAAPFIGQIWAIAGPGQDYLETVAITFAVWLTIPSLCVAANFMGTLRDSWDRASSDPAIRFVVAGTAFLVLGTIQQGVGSIRSFQSVVGHTTWDIATGTAITGGLGFFLIALVYYQFPKMIGRELYSAAWATRQFWAQTIGIATVVLSTSIAGLIQGYLQIAAVQANAKTSLGDGWAVITEALRPLFYVRIGGGGLVALGLLLFVRNIVRTASDAPDAEVEKLPFELADAEAVKVGA